MINKIRIRNFRAIDDLHLDLRPFQVLIGENNSGKTTFLDALLCLQKMSVLALAQAWTGSRFDFDRNLRVNAGAAEIAWEIETDAGVRSILAIGKTDVRDQTYLCVRDESLAVNDTVLYRRGWNRQGQWEPSASAGFSDPGWGIWMLPALSQTSGNLSTIHTLLSSIRRYVLVPRAMVRPASADAELQETGAGFPGFLDRLQNQAPEQFERLHREIQKVFPRIRYVRTPPTAAGEREISVLEESSAHAIYGSQLSDGVLLLLGYLAITLSGRELPSVLMLDEPEIGLHMGRSGFLVELLRNLSQGKLGRPVQVIVTTHSPDIVDFLQPEELVVFDRDDTGGIRALRPDAEHLKNRMKGFNLGEFWAIHGERSLVHGDDE